MMNKSKIDWCDFTWNPVTGCRHGCEYCYARKQAHRFAGDPRMNVTDPQIEEADGPRGKVYTLRQPFKNSRGAVIPYPAGFEPTLHEYRLADIARKKKPATIFVCSMADLFADDVPDEWIEKVFEACRAAPWHNYLFLTKNPTRYLSRAKAGRLPNEKNFWYGTTITGPYAQLFFSGSYNTFLSIEPIHAYFGKESPDYWSTPGATKWIIVGAETGNRKGKIAPERVWIENVAKAAERAEIPLLMKDSPELRAVWGDDLIQQFPEQLRPMSEDNSVPHCRGCSKALVEHQGKRGDSITCMAAGLEAARLVGGRYARSSPPWCPQRDRKDE